MTTTDLEIPESSLPVVDGRIYHLSVGTEELADYIIVVGDPERVPKVADQFLDKIEHDRSHRGLRTITGITKNGGVRISIVTTGMGTPSLEIVVNELIALHELNLTTRKPLGTPRSKKPLTIIRVGTSGAIRSGTALGTCIIARYSIGLDNTATYYDCPATPVLEGIEKKVTDALRAAARPGSRFGSRLAPYAAEASPEVVAALEKVAVENKIPHKVGLTASAAGFFANQGREIRPLLKVTVPNVDSVVGSVDLSDVPGIASPDLKIENLEMESATLFHICSMVGYRAGAVCCTVAQRRTGEFLDKQAEAVYNASKLAVDALVAIAKEDEKKGL